MRTCGVKIIAKNNKVARSLSLSLLLELFRVCAPRSNEKMAFPDYRCRKKKGLNLVDKLWHRECAFPVTNRLPSVWTRTLIDRNIEHSSKFYQKDLLGHYGCVNSLEFSPDGDFLASGGDDKRVLLWKVWDAIHDPKYEPHLMKSTHNSNIFCVSFDTAQQRLYTGGNDELVIIHNIETGEPIDVISHMDDVYGVSVNPFNNNLFVSASSEVMLWDLRGPSELSTQLAVGSAPFHAAMYNPCDSNIVATANSRDGVDLYDVRRPMLKLFHFYSSSIMFSRNAMCVRFNRAGNHLLSLRQCLSPILYDMRSPYPLAEFDSPDYYNSCTLKDCCFIGEDDQFVASGSDNFKIYIWKIPDSFSNCASDENPLKRNNFHKIKEASQVLSGHRSIVNKVQFNYKNGIIASSGIEKMIKLWSPLVKFDEIGKCTAADNQKKKKKSNSPRKLFSYSDYLSFAQRDRDTMPHDYSSNSTAEDLRMMAYFDMMIEREITSSWMSSTDEDSPSYLSHLRNEIKPKSAIGVDSDSDQVTFDDVSTDSGEKFSLQKRFDFTQEFDPEILSSSDYLHYVFAKRFYVRYINSFLEGLLNQIKEINCNLRNKKDSAFNMSKIDLQKKSEKVLPGRMIFAPEQFTLLKLNEKIKLKKDDSLILFAYKFARYILGSLYFGVIFQKMELQYFGKHLDDTELLTKSKAPIVREINNMSRFRLAKRNGRTICDKRIHNQLNTLYKRAVELLTLLHASESEVKKRCKNLLGELTKFPTLKLENRVSFSSSDSEEIVFNNESDNENSEVDFPHLSPNSSTSSSSFSSSTSLSSSSSSSTMSIVFPINEPSESGELASLVAISGAENVKQDLHGDDANSSFVIGVASTSTGGGGNVDNQSSAPTTSEQERANTSKAIYFKKSNRKNKNFKKRSMPKRRRKVCKNKRQRRS